jgi:uncharacterized LabA/DUF88 family protein
VSKNVAVFVDVANIFYAAKAAGVDIDYVTLLKASSAGRDLVRAYAYTGLDPENENQRNFHDFLRRHGYRVVSKDIRKYGDGKVKANLDIELVVDMLKTARNLDVAIVVSGDGDFAPAIRAVQEMGVRVEVVSFRGNTSSDLMDVADQFTDITQIAKVEKGSSRSGRRVAGDEADLSMTEVPEKQSEGAAERGRGRGRTRRVTEPAVAASGRSRSRRVSTTGDAALVVLPGEKLSRAAVASDSAADEGGAEATELESESVEAAAADSQAVDGELGEDGQRRRRRRRGGRGRGRGRGREEGYPETAAGDRDFDADLDEAEPDVTPTRPRPSSTFGSVWDSQIGIPAASRTTSEAPLGADEDLDEPEIPEYLLTERRNRESGRGRGGRGRGGAYAAALERERFGGGRGAGISRYAEPPRRRDPGRDAGGGRREPAPARGGGRPAPRSSGGEPWSEVPPEIEAMLRAQLGTAPARRPAAPEISATPPPDAAPEASAARPARRSTGRARTTAATTAPPTAEAGDMAAATPEAKPATRRRSTRTATTEPGVDGAAAAATATEKPKRTTRTRKPAASKATTAADAGEAGSGDAPVPTRRRTTRTKADPAA